MFLWRTSALCFGGARFVVGRVFQAALGFVFAPTIVFRRRFRFEFFLLLMAMDEFNEFFVTSDHFVVIFKICERI